MTLPKQSLIALLCIVLVVACSGSDGEMVAPAPTPSNMAKIDASNAASIVGGVLDAVFTSGSFDDVLSDSGVGVMIGQTNNGMSKLGGPKLAGLLRYSASVPIPGTNRPCVFIGDLSVSGEVSDPTTLSAGDRIVREFFDCDDGAGQILNGSYEIVINSFSGDLGQGLFNLNATVTFNSFEVTEGRERTSLNGAATLQLDTSMPPITSISVSGDSVSVGDNTDSATLSAFQTDVTHDAGVAPEAYTSAASGTLSSSLFEGEVNYSTPLTFQGFAGEYPFAGELLVTGADGASVRLITFDNVNVRLQIDAGDGSGIVTRDTTWAQLAVNVP